MRLEKLGYGPSAGVSCPRWVSGATPEGDHESAEADKMGDSQV
jgi:hypothetical protein